MRIFRQDAPMKTIVKKIGGKITIPMLHSCPPISRIQCGRVCWVVGVFDPSHSAESHPYRPRKGMLQSTTQLFVYICNTSILSVWSCEKPRCHLAFKNHGEHVDLVAQGEKRYGISIFLIDYELPGRTTSSRKFKILSWMYEACEHSCSFA